MTEAKFTVVPRAKWHKPNLFKICRSCGFSGSSDLFKPRYNICKECKKLEGKRYYEENRERVNARIKECRLKNQDRYKAVQKKWIDSHPENRRAAVARYAKRHPEKVKFHRSRYYKTPSGVASNAHSRARLMAIKRGTKCVADRKQMMAIRVAANGTCSYCKRKVSRLTYDHVMPFILGGDHSADNIVMACRSCNSKKNGMHPDAWREKLRVLFPALYP